MNDAIYRIEYVQKGRQVFRNVAFDSETFDALQDLKRELAAYHDGDINNAETLRVALLSHPWVNPDLYRKAP